MYPPASSYLFLVFILTASIATAADQNALSAYDVLKQYKFPIGLLPKGVRGYEINRNSGSFKVYLNKTCTFNIDGYDLKYKSTISGMISESKIYNLKGISVNQLLLWWNIQEVRRQSEELAFSIGIASANFALDDFNQSPQCGCGFHCGAGAGEEKNKKDVFFKRFNSTFMD
ncbi:uncharacterized protein LOC124940148 [Impatiens glandulifera]|uniref:uncharacterized protein LOC124940148 n=1 Tax=Impatiens glandulifera TaxID=253017 RepID=UPI001FB15B73|nr:uncharacterized protein LOC124940148 [Impatiens glandulifera]